MITREHILSEIRRTAIANDGKPLGTQRFFKETGIKTSDWSGKFWARWGDALTESGFRPNKLTGPRAEAEVLGCLMGLVRELGRFPVTGELRLKARTDPKFPSHTTFDKFGSRKALAAKLLQFCVEHGESDLAGLCVLPATAQAKMAEGDEEKGDLKEPGYVYLIKYGRFFKIGRPNSVGRREREIVLQLPERAGVVHQIKTDDPSGIEKYWHERFAARRKNGEWFDLGQADIQAFRRRKFM